MTTELKPCPFCGGEAGCYRNTFRHHNDGEHDIECKNCDAAIRKCCSEEDAITAWNSRASAPPVGEGMREKVAAIIRDHVQVGDIGECFVELTGQEEAADAILALLSSGEA